MSRRSKFLLPSLAGWYGPTEPGSEVHVMDGSRPRRMELKPVIIGEWLNTRGEGPHGDLSGRPARILAGALGVTYETFICFFERANLLKWWASDKLPRPSSLKVIATGFPVPRGAPLILFGGRVAEAMEFDEEFYRWGRLGTADCVAIRRPKGPDLVYNRPSERAKVETALREALLYHGKTFRVGEYPFGQGSLVMIERGHVWGDAERRLRHHPKPEDPLDGAD